MNNHTFGIPALQHRVLEGSYREGCFHAVINRVPNDPVRPHVFDRAEIQLPVSRPMLAAADGTAIFALADGLVTYAGMVDGYSGQITIEHTIGGEKVATKYIHMWAHGIHITAGNHVVVGQHIGDDGSSGHSTGPHLHFQVHPGGANHPPVDAEPWLAAQGVEGLDSPVGGGPGCSA